MDKNIPNMTCGKPTGTNISYECQANFTTPNNQPENESNKKNTHQITKTLILY